MGLSALRKQRLFNSLVALSLGFNFIFSNVALALDKDRQVYGLRGMSAGEKFGSSPLLDFVLQSIYRDSGISGLKKTLADLALRAPKDPVEKALKEGTGNIVIVEDKAGNLYRVSLEGNGSKTKINLAEKEESATEDFASVEAFLEFIAASNKIWASGSEYTPQQIIDAQREVKDYFQKAIRQKRIFAKEGLDIQIHEYLAERISRGLPALTPDEGNKLKERLEKAFSFHSRMPKNAETKLRKIAFILDEEPSFINLDGPHNSIFRMVAAGLGRESYPFPLDLVEAYNSPAAKEDDIFPMYRALMERYLGIDKDVFHQLRLPSLWQDVSAELKNRRHSAAKKRIKEESRMSIAEVHSVNISGFVNILDEKAKAALMLGASVELDKRLKNGLFQRYSLDWNRGDMLIFTLRANKTGLVNDSRVFPAINSAALAALEEAKKRGIYKGSDLGKEFRSQIQALKIARKRFVKYSGEPQGWVREIYGRDVERLYDISSLDNVDIKGKTVLVQVDFNVPAENGHIKDIANPHSRIIEGARTIKELAEKGAKVLVMFHQGRLGEPDFMDMPFEHSRQLSQVIGRQVKAVNDLFGREAVEAIGGIKNGDILVLKPARAKDPFTGRTLEESPYFISTLFPLIDFVVNDALSVSHRTSQRVAGFRGKPALGGRLLIQELQEARGLTALSHPSLFVVGGGKIPEKYKGFKFALKHFDKAIIGGRLAYLALIARQKEAVNAVTLAQQKALAVKTLGKTTADDLEKEKDDITQESVLSYIPEMAALISEHRNKIAVPLDMAYLEGEKGKETRVYIKLLDGRVPEGFDKQLSGIGRETASFYAEIVNRRQEPFQSAFVMGPPSDTRYSVLFDEIRAVLDPVSRIKEWYSGGGDTEDICKKLGITNAAYVFKAGGALADGLDKGFDNLPGVKFLIENKADSPKPFVPSNREEAHIRAHSLALAPVLEAAATEGGRLIARTIVIPSGDKVGAIGAKQDPALALAVTNSIAEGPRRALSGFEVLEVNKQNPWLDYSISTLRSLDSRPLMIEGVREALRENPDTVLIEIPAEKDKKGKTGKPGQVDTRKLLYRWNNMLITALREKGINQSFKVREVRPLPVFVQALESSHSGELKLAVFVPVPNTTLWNLMQLAQYNGINLKEFFEEAMPAPKPKAGSEKKVFAPALQEKAAEVVKDTPEQKPESGYPRFLKGVDLEAVKLNSASINAELQTIYYNEPETTLFARIRDSFGKNPKLIKILEADFEKICAWLLKEFKMGRIVVPSGGELEKLLDGRIQEEKFRKDFTFQKHILGHDSKQKVFIIQPRIDCVTVGYGNEAIKVIPAFEASGFGVPNVAIFSLDRRERVIHAFEMGYNVYITDRFEKDTSSKKTVNLYLNYPERLAAFEAELKGLVGEEHFSRQYKGLLSKAFQEGRFNLIIDATPEGAAPENKKLLYKPALSANPDLKVIYQGGEKEGIAEMSFSAATADYDKIYKTGSLRQVSCNTTFLSTLALTILRWLKTDLAIDNLAFRRVVDPGDVKGAVITSQFATAYHHGPDLYTVTPEEYIGFIKGKVNTDASQSGATTNYHIQIQYLRRVDGRPLYKKEAQEALKERSYGRLAVVDFPKDEFDSTRINEIAHNLLPQYLKNTPLGANHILIPIVTVQETDDPSELRIIAAVPQESIVAPSNVNAAHALFGLASQEASLAVVNDALGIAGIKQAVEKRLPLAVSAGQKERVLSGVYDLLKKKISLTVKDLKESRLGLFFEKAYASQDILDELARTRWTVKKESVNGETVYFYRPMRLLVQANNKTDLKTAKEIGSDGVLGGHSEDRQEHGMTNNNVNDLLRRAFDAGFTHNAMAFGEPADMRYPKGDKEEGKLKPEGKLFLERQISEGLKDLFSKRIEELVVAYEPIWAIGVKAIRPARPEEAQEVQKAVRLQLSQLVPAGENKIIIQYGGSMNAKNGSDLMAQPDVDGGLIGTASLKKEDALQLIRTVVAAVRAQKKTGVFSGRIPVIGFNLKAEVGGKKMEESYLKELMDTYRFIEENLRGIDLENDVRIFFALPQTDIFLFDLALKGQRPMDLLDLSRADLPAGIKLAVDIKEVSQFEPGAHTASLTSEALRLAGVKKIWNSQGVSTDDPRIKRANEAGLEVFQGADISFAATIEGIKRLLDNPGKDKIIVVPPALARQAHAYARDREREKRETSSAIEKKKEIIKSLELRNKEGKSNFPAHILMEDPELFGQARNLKAPIYSKLDQTIYVWDVDGLEEAVRKQYEEGKNDEAMISIITVGNEGLPLARLAQGGDIFDANYRKDRQIQWIDAIVNERFKGFNVPDAAKNIDITGMTKYTAEFPLGKTAIADEKVEDGLVETLYKNDIATVVVFDGEKGKFVPVFRGGREEPYSNEDLEFASISMPVLMNKEQIERYKPDVSTRLREDKDEYIAWFYKDVPKELEKQRLSNSQYWMYPGLSALLLAKLNAQKIMSAKPGTLGVTNIDLPDLIGHVAIKNLNKTAELFVEKEDGSFEIKKGNGWDSVLECLRISDKAEDIILKSLEKREGVLILVGDHGSVDDMTQPNHSFNEVPVFIVDFKHKDVKLVKAKGTAKDTQANVAVTALHILGIKKPEGMTGRNLLPESYEGSRDRIVWYNILDGFGHTDLNDPQNAFGTAMAKGMMPRIKELYAQNNYLLLKASGYHSGLRGGRQEDFDKKEILSRDKMLEKVKIYKPAMIKITLYDYKDIPGSVSLYDYEKGIFELGYSPFLNDKDFVLRWSDERTLEALCLDLPQMGSTEYNTWTLGAGSIVRQSVVSLDELFIRGGLSLNPAIKAYAELAKKQGYAHFTAILQEAGVHASARQLYYLVKYLKDQGVLRFVFDLASDGRDEPAQDSIKRIGELRLALKYLGVSDYIINIRGREICFDRDNKWYLTESWLNELIWGSRVNRRPDFILQNLRDIYKEIAPKYAAIWGKNVQKEVIDHMENFAKFIPVGGKIVDIGTIGRDIDWFGKRGFEAVGISDNPEMLKEARKLYPGLLLQEMDARRLKFKTGSQDGVWDNATFHHIPPESSGQVLEEYARVLKPTGALFIRVKEGEGEIEQETPEYPGKKRYFKLYGEQELRDLTSAYGFEVIKSGSQPDSGVLGRSPRNENNKWVYIFARKKTDTGPARDSQLDQDVAELAQNGFGSKETQLDLSLKGIIPQVSSSIESLAQLKASLGREKGPVISDEDIFNSIPTLQDAGMDYELSEASLSRQEEKIILIDGSVLENDYSALWTIGRINRQFNERLGVFEEKGQAVTAANPENPYKFILVGRILKDRKAAEDLLAIAAGRELGKNDPRDPQVRERVKDYQKRFTKILTGEDMYDKLDLNNSPSIENPEYVIRQLRWTLGAGFSAEKIAAFVGPREWVEGFKKRENISSQAQGIIVGQEKDKIALAGLGLYAAVEGSNDQYVTVESRDIAAGIEGEIKSYREEVDAYI